MFEPAIDQASGDTEAPRPAWRAHATAHTRSFVPANGSVYGTLLDRVVRWLMPWELREYPGLGRGSAQMLPFLSPHTVEHVRKGSRRIPPAAAAYLADMVEVECLRGLALVDELREAAAQPSRRTAGFREVKDWGDGVVGDKRNRGKKA